MRLNCLWLLLWSVSATALADELPQPVAAAVALPAPQRVVIDVRSRHSDGAHTPATLAGLARQRGIDVLGIGEHDRYTIRLGIDPFPRLLGYAQEHPSLHETGLGSFFDDLRRLRAANPALTILAGTESTPGYYWSGLPFRDLTLHGAERHLIALGIERPEQVEALPSYTLENIRGSRQLSLLFWGGMALLLLAVLLLTHSRRRRHLAGWLLLAVGGVLLYWWLKPVVDADAAFIAEARQQGLFVIWTHPGTLSGVRDGPMGVKLETQPYSQRVFEEPTADAFAAVYGDTDRNSEPGGLWDRYMMAYLQGQRPAPIWGVAAGDYHEEGGANEYLGNVPMDVWAADRTPRAVLAAMRQGRMTAWQQPRNRNLFCSTLYLQTADGRQLLPGDEATVTGQVRLAAQLGEWQRPGSAVAESQPLQGEWVVDGRAEAAVTLVPGEATAELELALPPGPHVIRLRIPMQHGIRMEANPFLLRVRQ